MVPCLEVIEAVANKHGGLRLVGSSSDVYGCAGMLPRMAEAFEVARDDYGDLLYVGLLAILGVS